MPENWDPAIYRDRAHRWRARAAILPCEDPGRAVCLELAEGYERLAALLEQQQRLIPKRTPDSDNRRR
jgi:hypothetical protein